MSLSEPVKRQHEYSREVFVMVRQLSARVASRNLSFIDSYGVYMNEIKLVLAD